MTDIVVIGSLNMDLVVAVPRLPKIGETIRGSDLIRVPGGKGANQAAAAALLGSQVLMIGRVGQDEFGSSLVQKLSSYGIDTSGITVDPDVVTGTALVAFDPSGENSIVICAGANARVLPKDIDQYEDTIGKARLILLQLELPLDTVCRAIDLAVKHDVPVVLNPAPFAQIPVSTLRKVSYLIPNEVEAAQLTGIDVRDLPSAERAATKLLGLGVDVVVITLGKNGCLLRDRHQTMHVPAPTVSAVDSTAAGDAFIGGLSSQIALGRPCANSLRWANCAAALTVTRKGAQTSLPSLEELNKFVSELDATQGEVSADRQPKILMGELRSRVIERRRLRRKRAS